MTIESIKAHVLAVPEVVAWPKMADFFENAEKKPRPDWNLPLLACQAVGGDVSLATPGAAAAACMYISIILVDDMLDEDPRGEYLRSGHGPTANLALAFQAAAFRVFEHTTISTDLRAAITASLARLALGTALGQHWDTQSLTGEENCWKVLRAKSAPFFGAALHIGALLGGAEAEVADGLRDFGGLIGEIIQIRDDLLDAFQTPASPDWVQGHDTLPILYARTADHPDRTRFMDLLQQIDDPQALREAQGILINCGAVSYCAYHLAKRHQYARGLLDGIPLAVPAPMWDLLARQTLPLVKLLQTSGSEIPPELLLNMQK